LKKIKLQIVYMVVFFINFIHKVIFFHVIRNVFLRCFGITYCTTSAIHSNVRFFHVGNFEMGACSTINNGCYIDNRRLVKIGTNVNISHDCKIYTLGHDINSEDFIATGSAVIISDWACLFSNVIVCPGVTIGEGAVVYPGSVVVKDVAPYTVVGGNPAKYIKERSRNLSYKIDYRYWFSL
jgi:acetyltransferase-like isoleucine patch superfamily enzyme